MTNGTSIIEKVISEIPGTLLLIAKTKRDKEEWDRAVLKEKLGPRKYYAYVTSNNQKGSD